VTARATRLALLVMGSVVCAPVHWVLADGALPPIPYRYVHPPAALARENKPPQGIESTLPAHGGAASALRVFTGDGQVGLTAPAGTFRVPPGSGLRISIQPLDAAVTLPGLTALDGNVYRLTVAATRNGGKVTVVHPFSLTFRWPHLPTAIYRSASLNGGAANAWARVCYSDQGTLTGFTLTCGSRLTGTYAVGTSPLNSTVRRPHTPIVRSRLAWLDPYIPILAAILVLIATSMLLYAVAWPRRGRGGGQGA
jgi:hypothetical protein